MTPPIFQTVNVPAVQALLKTGTGPLRFYAWGMAPQDVALPYAVWQLVGGTPENYLADRPDMDGSVVQIDVYASALSAGAAQARAVAIALRDEIEKVAYVTFIRGEGIDPETKRHTFGFDSDWLTPRT